MPLTWEDIAASNARINRANGWYDKERTQDESVLLLIDEAMEAFRALRNGKDKPSEKIPAYSCWQEELADTLIRFLDGWNRGEKGYYFDRRCATERVNDTAPVFTGKKPFELKTALIHLRYVCEYTPQNPTYAFEWALGELKRDGVDIEALLLAKLEYNRGRGYRHGGKEI